MNYLQYQVRALSLNLVYQPHDFPLALQPFASGHQIVDLLSVVTNELFPSDSLPIGSIPPGAHEIHPGQNSAVKLKFSINKPSELNNDNSSLVIKRVIRHSKLTAGYRKTPSRLTPSRLDSTKRLLLLILWLVDVVKLCCSCFEKSVSVNICVCKNMVEMIDYVVLVFDL